jgi:hypothetical protein
MKNLTKLYIGLFILCILTPIGLMASGDAWGEWGKEAFIKMIGYVPKGLERFSDFWKAPFPDYTFKGTGDYISYIISAFAGVLLVIICTWIIGKIVARKK